MRVLNRGTAVVAAAALLVTITGCSSEPATNEEGAGAASSAGPIDLKVGYLGITDFYTVKLAEQEGFFADEGLNVTLVPITSGNQQVALLQSGQLDVGGSGPAEVLTAAANGLPIKLLEVGDHIPTTPETETRGIVVAPDSTITDAADLDDKTVAVSNLLNSPHLDAMSAIKNEGGDPSEIDFVAIPAGQQWDAVKSGQVDAAIMNEPAFTGALLEGANVIVYPEMSGDNDLGFSYFTTGDILSKKTDALAAFVAAMTSSVEFANANPDAIREFVQADGVSSEVADDMRLPEFTSTLDAEELQPMINMLKEFGVTTNEIDPTTLIATF